MVLDVVEISRTGLISADKSENIDPVDEESALLDKDDGAETALRGMSNECSSRARQLTAARSLGMSEPLTLETV
ncbi:hypothetical protein TNCV_4328571 [Trichonephila clavipes]|nr:hypothetical protein TNCV_4328571 [Trichonephila clavipes]